MKQILTSIVTLTIGAAASAETVLADSPANFAIASALTLKSAHKDLGLALDEDQSIHHFALKPSQAKRISKANALITIGPKLFPQINDAFGNLNPTAKIISISEELELDHDPHFWTSPMMVLKAARYIDPFLPSRDPIGEHLLRLEENLTAIDNRLGDVEFSRGIIVGHDAFQGFINAYNIPYFGALTDEHDHAAAPKARQEIEDAVKNGDADCLVLDASEPNEELEKFATDNGIDFVYVDVLGWSFLKPNADHFFDEYYAQIAEAFADCTISELVPLSAQ